MHATKAAVEEGIVPGGGVALLRASKVLKDLTLTADEQIGVTDLYYRPYTDSCRGGDSS